MAAAFIVLLGISLVILLISHKENHESRLYRLVAVFAAVVLAYCMLYFYFYFRDMILEEYAVGLPLRLVDYILNGAIPFLWLQIIGELIGEESRASAWAWIVGLLRAGAGTLAAFFMNGYYGFESDTAGIMFVLVESVLSLLAVCVIGYYSLRLIRTTTSSRRQRYVGFVSIVFCLWDIMQQIVDGCLYTGRFVSAWAEGVPDTTAPAVFLMGLATFLFLFREDFSPLFYLDAKAGGAGDDPASETAGQTAAAQAMEPGQTAAAQATRPAGAEKTAKAAGPDLLELAAAQHGLTVRELDVLRLVYEGRNNPEIAEALFISRNTVKKHLQNIYEKTGVNSRMELIYIVNLKK